MRTALLFSGGMDSLIAWEYLGRPDCIYVDMGHKYHASELRVCNLLMGNKLKIVSASFMKTYEKEDAEIPARNLFLAMVAALEGYDNIALTVQVDETSIPDRTLEFFEKTSEQLSALFGRQIKVFSPFLHLSQMDKVEMVKWYLSEGHDVDALLNTWACYSPVVESVPCGSCPACFRRFVALSLNGLSEYWYPTIKFSPVAKEYKARAQNGYYSPERSAHILKALEGVEI